MLNMAIWACYGQANYRKHMSGAEGGVVGVRGAVLV